MKRLLLLAMLVAPAPLSASPLPTCQSFLLSTMLYQNGGNAPWCQFGGLVFSQFTFDAWTNWPGSSHPSAFQFDFVHAGSQVTVSATPVGSATWTLPVDQYGAGYAYGYYGFYAAAAPGTTLLAQYLTQGGLFGAIGPASLAFDFILNATFESATVTLRGPAGVNIPGGTSGNLLLNPTSASSSHYFSIDYNGTGAEGADPMLWVPGNRGNLVYDPTFSTTFIISTVPEPATFVLTGSGLLALAAARWRRRRL